MKKGEMKEVGKEEGRCSGEERGGRAKERGGEWAEE